MMACNGSLTDYSLTTLHNKKVTPVSHAEVTIGVDNGSMNHWGGQPTVTEVVQGSAGENLKIFGNFDADMLRLSGDENLVNIS